MIDDIVFIVTIFALFSAICLFISGIYNLFFSDWKEDKTLGFGLLVLSIFFSVPCGRVLGWW